ncbi:tetratricopeptide repeat protein [Brevibacillus brevis]|uniref:tetratricopeptide repeat protein n=1 Tax=Brevibacillus brevis TaxID=1393 RepID=UPI0025A51780|nr:tetratricopeptide repeat protein [Brevibacillus brevis]WJQ81149.1 tetratricopeptide repeat protein [Brevibacillus brevis]
MHIKRTIYSLLLVTSMIISSACSDNDKVAPDGGASNTAPSSQSGQKGTVSNEVAKKFEQGVSLYNQEKLDEALNVFQECITQDPASGQYEYYIGNIMRKKKDLQNALVNYQNAIKKSPDLIEAYNNSAAILMATQNYDQALQTVNDGLSKQPDFKDLQFKKAQLLYVQQQFKDSIALLAPLAQDPAYFEANRFLGLSYNNLGDKAKALEHFNAYLKLAPEGVPFKETVKQIVAELEKGK